MILVDHVINFKGSQIIIALPVITVHIIYWDLGSLCLPFLGFTSPDNIGSLVTVMTLFVFERTTFMTMISQTAVVTLTTRLFRGWGTLFPWKLSFFLRFRLLAWPWLGWLIDWVWLFTSLESFNILLRLLNSDALRYSNVKCQFLEFEIQELWHHSLISNTRNQSIPEPFQTHGISKLAIRSLML